ncbi:MAG: neutral/alkaline non-lysosomal ceramidase N-terminal domain-containing protein [Pirellulaceae bacterium]
MATPRREYWRGARLRLIRRFAVTLLLALAVLSPQAMADTPADCPWKIGVARVNITPPRPVVLLGYGDRPGPFTSVAADIYAKALVIEDRHGHRGVIVTADLVGFQAAVVTDEVCRRLAETTGLERRQLLFNASHTHTGPLVSLRPHLRANAVAHAPLTPAEAAETVAYTHQLREQLVTLVCDALRELQPARLAWGAGEVEFPTNRRLPQDGRIVMADNPAGSTDRSVPVLRVQAADGRILAVLFGCACHNATLTGRDNVVAGDYAGFAQEMIEQRHRDALALFMSGCGADANPSPRGSMELARQHGERLMQEVDRVLSGPLMPLTGDLATTLHHVALPLQTLTRDQVAERTSWPSAEAVMAQQMLALLDRGEQLPTTYRAPLAVWQFGTDLTLVGLPAEPVAEYVARLQQSLGAERMWVAGFNNDCFGYLPTARVVRERGHEAIGVTLWIWGQDLQTQVGFFAPEVEEIVLRTTRQLALEAGRQVADDLSSAAAPFPVRTEKNVRIPLRDGISLAADIVRPEGAGPFPALLQVSYYVTGPGIAEMMAPRGYVRVLANSRGRGGSDGEWDPYLNEPRDVFDAQLWVAQQPWCNGRVGMFGQSYNAFTQTMSAPLANPHFLCMVPVEGQQSFFGHQFNDGVLQLNVVFTHGLFATGATGLQGHIPIDDPHFLQLPLVAAADRVPHPQAQRIKTWLAHARYDDHWKSFSVKDKSHQIQTPAYFVTGWYDNLVHENFRNFLGFREKGGSPAVRQQTRLRVGPGVHGANPLPLVEYCRWYDFWLKGQPTGIDQEAPLQIFVMGTNCWRDEYEWPLARTEFTKYYLHSNGRANSIAGDGRLVPTPAPLAAPPDHYVYDPDQPVYTLGGPISTNPEVWGPQDRQTVAARDDVLVFTSEPLSEDTEVTGPVDLVLYAASTAVDTDFAATLTDVHPDGRAIHICEGIRGATFRESLEEPTPIEPERIYQYTISLWETSHLFAAGHRVRLEVTSSNFPRYARNQNTGLPLGTSAEIKIARQTVFHDALRPSHLMLPVIPAATSTTVAARPDGSWRLTAGTAHVRGPTLKLATDAGILGWWTSDEDEAEWTIDVTQSGRYRVRLNFACDLAVAGNHFQLVIGESRITGQVPATGTWFDQRELDFGEIDLGEGLQCVTLRSAGPIHGALFDLRAVTLARP